MYWQKILVNGLLAFFTTFAGVNMAGLEGNALIAALIGALITAAISTLNEMKLEVDKADKITIPIKKRKLSNAMLVF